MRGVTAGALVLLFTAGCGDVTEPLPVPHGALVSAPTELALRMGQESVVPGSQVAVRFTGVPEDSRCPIDVVCVWAGNAVVELAVRAGAGAATTLQINTHLEPRFADWRGVRFAILDLQPAPSAAQPTRQDDYQVRVRIEPAP